MSIPVQPPIWYSYLRSGRLLYLSLLLFILESLTFWHLMKWAFQSERWFWFSFLLVCFGFSFVHIFLVGADGWSRYQNYKRVKDQLFMYGFHPRILAHYKSSMCQRIAAITAAEELGLATEASAFFYSIGYRWYHLIPDFMTRDYLFFMKRSFWSRTFLEKHYQSKFDFHALWAKQKISYDSG